MLASPTILAFDTATGPCSVAVWKDGKIASYLETSVAVTQSTRLVPMIEEALRKTNTAYRDLTVVACTIGPGSFTGIRVGLAAARGICFASGVKGVGFTTLQTLAYSARDSKLPVLAVLNAGKGEHYYQGFMETSFKPLFEPQLSTLDLASERMPEAFVTVGNAEIPGIEATPVRFPRADALAALAAAEPESGTALKPFYIRPPDATPLVNRKQPLL